MIICGLCGEEPANCACETLPDGYRVQHVNSSRCWCKPMYDDEADCLRHRYGVSESERENHVD